MSIPKEVEKVLLEYRNLLNEHLPGILEGLYIHGSIALGAYVEGSSDIDFITVTSRPLTRDDSEALATIHGTIKTKYEKPEMDGVYVQWQDIGKIYKEKSDLNDEYPYYNDGKLLLGEYFNFNPVTWWTLMNNGISVIGKDLTSFDFGITERDLYSYVLTNMNTYWAKRIQTVEKSIHQIQELPSSQIDEEIEWTILGLLRQFYTLRENKIISKLDAGKYGLEIVPDKWHPIITEAMNIRNGKTESYYDSEVERIRDVIHFSKYLIEACN